VFVCLLIYLRRHARCSDARRNALASGYVPLLPRARGRTSFHSAFWNVFNSSAGFFFPIYVVPALRGRPGGPTLDVKVNLVARAARTVAATRLIIPFVLKNVASVIRYRKERTRFRSEEAGSEEAMTRRSRIETRSFRSLGCIDIYSS